MPQSGSRGSPTLRTHTTLTSMRTTQQEGKKQALNLPTPCPVFPKTFVLQSCQTMTEKEQSLDKTGRDTGKSRRCLGTGWKRAIFTPSSPTAVASSMRLEQAFLSSQALPSPSSSLWLAPAVAAGGHV